jgi:hypothetical protein
MRVRGEPLVVSIQRSTTADAVAGHLASGLLIDRDRVVVPGPLDWLEDLAAPFLVLLASKLRDGSGVVERIGVDQASVIGLRDRPDDVVAFLELLHPAQHRPTYTGEFAPEAVTDLVVAGSAIWPALRDVGAVREPVWDRPLTEMLETVVEWERQLRRTLVLDRKFVTRETIGIDICCWFGCKTCDPDSPWWR